MIKPVYEDNHLLVVVKPQGKLTQSDETGDLSLQDECKQYIKEKYQKPGEVYLGLVHRLDRPVGGLVAFARTSKAASRLQRTAARSSYGTGISGRGGGGKPACGGHAVRLAFAGRKDRAGADSARRYARSQRSPAAPTERLGARDGTALVHLRLETGRKHQIRVQLSHLGYPIR